MSGSTDPHPAQPTGAGAQPATPRPRPRPSDRYVNRLIQLPAGVRMRLRVACLRALGAHFGSRCWIRHVELPRNPWDVWCDDLVALDRGVVLLTSGERGGGRGAGARGEAGRRIVIREHVYINRYTMIDASELVEIGAHTMIGPHCYITDHDHGTEPGTPVNRQPLIGAPTRLGRNVWMGAGVMILKGVTVGDDAVIAAGAVVTKDVPAGAIVGGVPARVLRDAAARAGAPR